VVAVSVGLAQPPGEVLAGSEVLVGVAAVDHRRTRCRYRGGVVLIPAGVGLGENGVAVGRIDPGVGLQLLAGCVIGSQVGLVAVLDGGVGAVGGLFPPARHHIQRRRCGLAGVLVVLVVLGVQSVDVGLARGRVGLRAVGEHGRRIGRPVGDRGRQCV